MMTNQNIIFSFFKSLALLQADHTETIRRNPAKTSYYPSLDTQHGK